MQQENKPSAKHQPNRDAEKSTAAQTLERQRKARQAKRLSDKRESLEPEIHRARHLIDNDKKLRRAYQILREAQSRLGIRDGESGGGGGGPPDREIRTLLARIALQDSPPNPAKAFELLAPFNTRLSKETTYQPADFDFHYTKAIARLVLANTSSPSDSQDEKQPTKHPSNGFFGVSIDSQKQDREQSNGSDRQDKPTNKASSSPDVDADRVREALRTFDVLAYHASREYDGPSRDAVLAAEGVGQAHFLLENYQQAVNAYKYALSHGKALANLNSEKTQRDKALLGRLRKRLNEARYQWDIERYGKAFVRYRDAERLRRKKGKYAKAIKVYKQLIDEYPDTVWADAAGLYIGYCLKNQDKIGQAFKHWQLFYDQSPHGLYRGEALLAMGDIHFEDRLDPDRAGDYYRKTIGWLSDLEQLDKIDAAAAHEVERRAKQVAAAAESRYTKDGWGNIKVSDNRIGAVINRLNAEWYLDNLAYQAHLKLGMTHSARANPKRAKAQYAELGQYDKRIKQDEAAIWDSVATRLSKAANPKGGGPRNENKHLKVFKGKRRVAAYLGNLYYDALKWGEARKVYKRLLNGEFGELTKPEKAYCIYLLGNIEHMAGNAKQAIKYLKVFEAEKFANTPIAAKALYTYGAIAAQYRMRGDQYEKTWQRVFPKVCKRYPESRHAKRALFHLAYGLDLIGKTDKAVPLYRTYLARYPEGGHENIVKDHLKTIANNGKGE